MLQKQIRIKKAELESIVATVSNNYNDHTFKEIIYADIEDLLTQDAVIGLLNCYAASDKSGEAFMKDLGDALLKKIAEELWETRGPSPIQICLGWSLT